MIIDQLTAAGNQTCAGKSTIEFNEFPGGTVARPGGLVMKRKKNTTSMAWSETGKYLKIQWFITGWGQSSSRSVGLCLWLNSMVYGRYNELDNYGSWGL